MRVLYYPQISMRSYVDRRWLVSSASQVVRMEAYRRLLPDDWQWMYVLPNKPLMDQNWRDVFFDNDCRWWFAPWADDVRKGRYFIAYPNVERAVQVFRPDTIITEVPEHAAALRMMAPDSKIVSFIVHVEDNPAPTALRQAEAFEYSDVVAFQNERERDLWFKHNDDAFPVQPPKAEVSLLKGMFTPQEARDRRNRNIDDVREKPPQTIFFTSRLSDAPRTKHDVFAEACQVLKERGIVNVQVWYANPNEAMDWKDVRKRPLYKRHMFGERTLTRQQYFDLLWQADVVPILYPNKSGGLCEAVATDNVLVTVKENEVPYGTVDDPTDPAEVAISLEHALAMRGEYRHKQLDHVMRLHSAEEHLGEIKRVLS